jgi:diacylglycerol kinase family enzyme
MKKVPVPARSAVTACILANPASGSLPLNQRYRLLKEAAVILGAEVHGLDTRSSEELAQCARELADRGVLLVVAGGDGSFSLVLNSVDLCQTRLAFLPFGTGNALTHALGYRGDIPCIAARLRAAGTHRLDLIDCDGRRKAFMTSLGIDGCAIGLYEKYKKRGYRGLNAHVRAGLRAALKAYRPTGARIAVDGGVRKIQNLYSLMVVKQPYFGMGLKVSPRARWDDGRLHLQTLAAGRLQLATALLTSVTIGNRAGEYRQGRRVSVSLQSPLALQIDGELGWTSERFDFQLISGGLMLTY